MNIIEEIIKFVIDYFRSPFGPLTAFGIVFFLMIYFFGWTVGTPVDKKSKQNLPFR